MLRLPVFLMLILTSLGFGEGEISKTPDGSKTSDGVPVLRVLTFYDPQSVAIFDLARDFEKKAQCVVTLRQMASTQVFHHSDLDLLYADFDLVVVDEPHLSEAMPHLLPFVEWPSTVHYEVPTDDVWLDRVSGHSEVNGVRLGVPVNPNLFLYAYRKDLFEDPAERAAFRAKYGYALKPPTNSQMYRDISEFFARPPGLYGFLPVRAVSEAQTIELLWALRLHDQDLFGGGMDEGAAHRALEFYQSLVQFGPEIASPTHYERRVRMLAEGNLAHAMIWPSYLPVLREFGEVNDLTSIAYSEGPSGDRLGPLALSGFWTMAIPRDAEQAQLAAEFAAFWSSRSVNVHLLRRFAKPSRQDVLLDPRFSSALPWMDSYLSGFENIVRRPVDPEYRQKSRQVAHAFETYLSGNGSATEVVEVLRELRFPESDPKQ